MIVGLGTDIVSIARIQSILDRDREAFLEQVFSPAERAEGLRRSKNAEYFAGRWAVKEAMGKALGCGIGGGCNWRDVITLTTPGGQPVTSLAGQGARTAAACGMVKIHVSLSHEREYACATVILEGEIPSVSGSGPD